MRFLKEITVAQKDEKAKVEKKAISAKPKSDRKNFIRKYFDETIGELRKVSWPTRKEAINLTIVVLVVMFAMSGLLGVLDFIYSKIFTLLFA
jgi:preprotein translocase subunit SecE